MADAAAAAAAAEAERKAKADRAKKLLAQRKKKKAGAGNALDVATPTPSSPGSVLADPPTVSTRTSLSLDESARSAIKSPPTVAAPLDKENVQIDHAHTNGDIATDTIAQEHKVDPEVEAPPALVAPAAGTTSDQTNGARKSIDQKPKPAESERAQSDSTLPPPLPTEDAKLPQRTPRPSITQSPSAESVANLQQTVSLLIAERGDLQIQISTLQSQLTAAKGDSQLLEEGRILIGQLEEGKKELEKRIEQLEGNAVKVEQLEKDVDSTRTDLKKAEGRIEELQVERDNLEAGLKDASERGKERTEELEKAVERSREREGGLEAEVGRLRQNNTDLSSKFDEATKELEALRASSSTADTTLTELKSEHDTLRTTHEALTSDHSKLEESHKSLTAMHDTLKTTHDEVSSSTSNLESTLSTTKSELENTKSKLGAANKRADAAEKRKTGLQNENDELVKQLEEVRGKVVQIMEEKVTLAGDIESWESKSKQWEKTRVELETQVEEAKTLHEQVSALAEENRSNAERVASLGLIEEQHKALVTEHETAKSTIATNEANLASLRSELDAAHAKNQEHGDLLSELDIAKQIISSRDETITDLRSTLSELQNVKASATPLPISPETSTSTTTAGQAQEDQASSNALRASHALETSELSTRIRNLEEILYARENKIHDLSKQLAEAYASAQAQAQAQKEVFSPGSASTSGKGGYFFSSANDITTPRPTLSRNDTLASASALGYAPSSPTATGLVGKGRPISTSTSMVDAILPASVRHKRQVSLTALKARMEAAHSHSPSKHIESVLEDNEDDGFSPGLSGSGGVGTPGNGKLQRGGGKRRQQFGDEIMFCCPACEGDLITL